jgi:hypothetical protein
MRNKIFYPFIHISFRADTTISAYLYINIKIDKVWTPTVTLTLVVETWVLFVAHDISMVIEYVKEKCILKFQSGHDHHLLYLYNIKNGKVWTPTVTLTLVVGTWVLFVTHHTFMVVSYMKEKLKFFHAYWSF